MQRTYCKVPHWSHRTHGLECQLYCAAHPAHTPLVSLLPYPKLGRTTPNVFWVFFFAINVPFTVVIFNYGFCKDPDFRYYLTS